MINCVQMVWRIEFTHILSNSAFNHNHFVNLPVRSQESRGQGSGARDQGFEFGVETLAANLIVS